MDMRGHNAQIAGNWIAISRDMRDHYLVGFGQPVKPANPKQGSFSRAEAWQDLLMLARWKDGPEINKGRKIEMLTGQLQGGYSFLADRWNWTMQTVRTFIEKLIGERMLEREKSDPECNKQKTNQVQVLSVCNYKKYQLITKLLELQEQQAANKRATSEQQHLNKETLIDPSGTTYLQDQSNAAQLDLLGGSPEQTEGAPGKASAKSAKPKGKAKKTPPGEYSESFGFFWEKYPRKEAKGEAFASWGRLSYGQQRKAYAALMRQLPVLTDRHNNPGRSLCAMPSTWLNQGRFDDEPDMPKQVNGHNGNGHYRAKPSTDEAWLDRELALARSQGLLG